MKVVLDTNVIVSGFLSPTSYTALILQQWAQNTKTFDILVSQAILDEYERMLAYPHLHIIPDEQQRFLTLLKKVASLVTPTQEITVVRDPSDNKFIECAVAGRAAYIVSSDPDLLELKEYQGIQILSPEQFLEVLAREQVV